ncbi:Endonuclease 2-like protein [Drosera capensis]
MWVKRRNSMEVKQYSEVESSALNLIVVVELSGEIEKHPSTQKPRMACAFPFLASLCLLLLVPAIHGWGKDGHYTTCKLAESYFTQATSTAVQTLLEPTGATDLATLCSWADDVREFLPWSRALHFANVPDDACDFEYSRDCKDSDGNLGRCVVGAIYNYTGQLLDYVNGTQTDYNYTQSLLFLSHFLGDVHQPLHCGHIGDKGGNTIEVYWYNTKTNLHHVWDTSMIYSEEDDFYNQSVDGLVQAINQNMTGVWSSSVQTWQTCSGSPLPCPSIYANESIKAACQWAYPNVTDGTTLGDEYFDTRYPVVNWQLAKGGARLGALLNLIFSSSS